MALLMWQNIEESVKRTFKAEIQLLELEVSIQCFSAAVSKAR